MDPIFHVKEFQRGAAFTHKSTVAVAGVFTHYRRTLFLFGKAAGVRILYKIKK